ncbi:MAG: hypothetical protein NUW12_09315 [Firmicutes bacterium]|nr:hypothetical protein [Bacillota bacterium]MDH7496175.1 hypothetical protein [Bacillota bacterium]
MLERPEAVVIAGQVNETLKGKRIESVIANHSPHKFARSPGDPREYDSRLKGLTIESAIAFGSMVEIAAGPVRIVLAEGTSPRYYRPGGKLPAKHQLLARFDDGSSLVGLVQMCGAVWAFPAVQLRNPYCLGARHRPSPLIDALEYARFEALLEGQSLDAPSERVFWATEQRIRGLGSGVLPNACGPPGSTQSVSCQPYPTTDCRPCSTRWSLFSRTWLSKAAGIPSATRSASQEDTGSHSAGTQ